MNQTATADDHAVTTPPRWMVSALWLLIVVLLAVALARIAVWLQSAHFSAVGVFPALFGAAIAFGLVTASRWLVIRSRASIISAAVITAILMAAAEHGYFYLDYRHDFVAKLQTDPNAQLAAALEPDQFQPATFYRFMAAEAPVKWPLWIFDAVTMITVATVVAWLTTPSRQLATDH